LGEEVVNRRPISKWPLTERPREKLLQEGPRSLSDSELLAIILRLGTKGASAIDLGREVLGHFGGFRHMADADLNEWEQIKGLGSAKTASLIAAVEIARRFWAEPSAPSEPIKAATQVVELFGPHLRDLKHEVFEVLLLNGKRRSLGSVRMDDGTVTETSTYAREIMLVALQKRAAGVVLVHNHPSGDPSPSSADTDLTRKAVFAGKVMDVKVQDHVVIGDKAFYSFLEDGVIARFEHEWEVIECKGVGNDH
jgi:DNA repair protein RadC